MAQIRYGECPKCIIANPKASPGISRRGDLVYDGLLREWSCPYCGYVDYGVTEEIREEAKQVTIPQSVKNHRQFQDEGTFARMGNDRGRTAPKYIELIERSGY